MRFGACIGMDTSKLSILKGAGYDYAETSAGSVARASQEDFDAFCAESVRCGMPVEAANCFVPGDVRLVGSARDDAKIREYLDGLIPRLSKLGVKVIVFGSSGARKMTEEMPREKAWEEVISFLKDFAAPIAAEYNISIAIEPLNKNEDNCINTVAEGVKVVEAVNLPNVKVLADIFHMICEDEDFGYLRTLKGTLLHAHTSSPINKNRNRVYMLPNDGYSQVPFISALAAAECPRCSVEAGTDNFEADAPLSLEIMKKALAQAN